jgi:hypothetical protein
MALVHTLKKVKNGEVVLKCYRTNSNGGTIQIELDDDEIKSNNETFIAGTSLVTIKEIFWGAKKDKQIDISRVTDSSANTIHGHYYLTNAGHYKFTGFVDDTYANGAIRIVGDGAFHVTLVLHKNGYG